MTRIVYSSNHNSKLERKICFSLYLSSSDNYIPIVWIISNIKSEKKRKRKKKGLLPLKRVTINDSENSLPPRPSYSFLSFPLCPKTSMKVSGIALVVCCLLSPFNSSEWMLWSRGGLLDSHLLRPPLTKPQLLLYCVHNFIHFLCHVHLLIFHSPYIH